MSVWRKVENENGYPSYVNDQSNIKQWDHPKFSDLKQNIDECNFIKYSSYRVASKIRVLQRFLFMDDISLSMMNAIFEKHRLGATEASLNLESYDLEAILSDIYFAANKQNHKNTDIDFATELMQNFLYNVYDKERKGCLQVVSTKLALAVLSSSKLSDLYRYIFSLSSDYNNTVTKFRLQNILGIFASIASFLHEDMHFGQHLIQNSVENCFKDVSGAIGITEGVFTTWLETGPQILSYLSILYRMRTSETVMHNARCSVCKSTPLLGLKYRCLRCSRYVQCQGCFLTGRTSHSHKLGHAVREYCTEKCPKELTHAFVKRLFGIIRCNVRATRHAGDHVQPRSLRADREWLLRPGESVRDLDVLPLSSPQAQLQVVIRQLELQNKELQTQMSLLRSRNDRDMRRYLEEHRLHIAAQIQKLKLLKDYLQSPQRPAPSASESTPMVRNGRVHHLDMFSPIVRQPDFSVIPEAPDSEWRSQLAFGSPAHDTACSLRDISTWIAERPTSPSSNATGATSSTYIPINSTQGETRGHVREMQSDLDAVLDKLQQILANNFSLDDTLSSADNDQLQEAVSEMEGMLSSLIDGVEQSRTNSALTSFPPEQELLLF